MCLFSIQLPGGLRQLQTGWAGSLCFGHWSTGHGVSWRPARAGLLTGKTAGRASLRLPGCPASRDSSPGYTEVTAGLGGVESPFWSHSWSKASSDSWGAELSGDSRLLFPFPALAHASLVNRRANARQWGGAGELGAGSDLPGGFAASFLLEKNRLAWTS